MGNPNLGFLPITVYQVKTETYTQKVKIHYIVHKNAWQILEQPKSDLRGDTLS